MYRSPDGVQFAFVAEAAWHALQARPDLLGYYSVFAPLTVQWLGFQGIAGNLARVTRFDTLLEQIVRRADYGKSASCNVVPFRSVDRPGR
jgi:hypothetical protein